MHLPPPHPPCFSLLQGSLNSTVDAFRALVRLMADNDTELNPEEVEDPITDIQLTVPTQLIGHLIGRLGASIKNITETSGCVVEIIQQQYPVAVVPFRMVRLEGTPRQMTHAFALILRKFVNAQRRGNPGAGMMVGMAMPGNVPGAGMRPPYMGPMAPAMMPAVETIKVMVPSWSVGALIGRGGANMQYMREQTGARITIDRHEGPEEERRVCSVAGTIDQQKNAQTLINQRIQDECARIGMDPSDQQASTFVAKYVVPAPKVGQVIGPRGNTIRQLQQTTMTRAQVFFFF